LGNKFFRLGNLIFVNDIGFALPARGFGLLAQDLFGEGIGHVDDGGIDIFLIGTQGKEIGRDPHDDIHERQVDQTGQVVRDRFGGLQITGGEMRHQILKRNFNLAGRKLAQDHVHGETDFSGGGARRFKFGDIGREHFLGKAAQDHADGQIHPATLRLRAKGFCVG
jgi:hypothetical protein